MLNRLKKICCTSVIIFALVEAILRLAGYSGHVIVPTDIHSNPENSIVYNEQYGLSLNPGTYKVKINNGLEYKATHLEDSTRITKYSGSPNQSMIHIYGCSFSYGMGVDDEKCFPYLVQQSLVDKQVKNFAVPGYSTVHALMKLQNEINNQRIPDTVIIGYTSYQDARNQLSGIQQKYWSESLILKNENGFDTARLPYFSPKKDRFEIHYMPLNKLEKRWPLSKYSAMVNQLERTASNIFYGFKDKYLLTEFTIGEINKLCSDYDIDLFVLSLDKSESGAKLKLYCSKNDIGFIDASLDVYNDTYNLQPFDSHPNELAHSYYANWIIDTFNKRNTSLVINNMSE
jgi:hypothetical protein